jgi:hypothetical protein
MRAFAEGLVAAERWEGERRLARLVWVKRGRQDLADAAGNRDLAAVEEAITTVTQEERDRVRVAAEVLLSALEARKHT